MLGLCSGRLRLGVCCIPQSQFLNSNMCCNPVVNVSVRLSCNRRVTATYASTLTSGDQHCNVKAYITAVRGMLGILTADEDALQLCKAAQQHLEDFLSTANSKLVSDWAADWVWLAAQHAKLLQQTSGAEPAKQVLLTALKHVGAIANPHIRPLLASYCHIGMADVLMGTGEAAAVLEASRHVDTALVYKLQLVEDPAEYGSAWLPPAVTQYTAQPQLEALCLLTKLEQIAAGWKLDPPVEQDPTKAFVNAQNACRQAFGYTSAQAKRVSWAG